jgi:hypothetical protein
MSEQLNDLIDTLIATDEHPTSWAWQADAADSGGRYIDCSTGVEDGLYNLEVGESVDSNGDRIVAVLDALSIDDLREIHRKLTLALAVATLAAATR